MRSDVVPLTISLYRRLNIKYQSWIQAWLLKLSGWEWKEQQCTAQLQHSSVRQQHQQTSCAILLLTPTSRGSKRSNHAASAEHLSRQTNIPTKGDASPKRSEICRIHFNQHMSYCRSKAAIQTTCPTSPQPFSPTVLTRWPSSCVPAVPKPWLGPHMGTYIVVYSSPHSGRHHQVQQRAISDMPKTKTTRVQTRQTHEEEVCKDVRSASSKTSKTEPGITLRIERRQCRRITAYQPRHQCESQTRKTTPSRQTWISTRSGKHFCAARNILPSSSTTAPFPRYCDHGQLCQRRCWRWGGGCGRTARRKTLRKKWNGRLLAVEGRTTQRIQRHASAYRSPPKYRECQRPRDSNSSIGSQPSAGTARMLKWSTLPRERVHHRQTGTGGATPTYNRTGCRRHMWDDEADGILCHQCKSKYGNRRRGIRPLCTKSCQRPERRLRHRTNTVPGQQRWTRQFRRTGASKPETAPPRYRSSDHLRRCRQPFSHRRPSPLHRSEGNTTSTPGTTRDLTSIPTQFSSLSRAFHTVQQAKWSKLPTKRSALRTQPCNRNSSSKPPNCRAAPPHGETGSSRHCNNSPRWGNSSLNSQIPLSITLEPRLWRTRGAPRAAAGGKREHSTRFRHQHFRISSQRAIHGYQQPPTSSASRMVCRGGPLAIMATATRCDAPVTPKTCAEPQHTPRTTRTDMESMQQLASSKDCRGLPMSPTLTPTRFASTGFLQTYQGRTPRRRQRAARADTRQSQETNQYSRKRTETGPRPIQEAHHPASQLNSSRNLGIQTQLRPTNGTCLDQSRPLSQRRTYRTSGWSCTTSRSRSKEDPEETDRCPRDQTGITQMSHSSTRTRRMGMVSSRMAVIIRTILTDRGHRRRRQTWSHITFEKKGIQENPRTTRRSEHGLATKQQACASAPDRSVHPGNGSHPNHLHGDVGNRSDGDDLRLKLGLCGWVQPSDRVSPICPLRGTEAPTPANSIAATPYYPAANGIELPNGRHPQPPPSQVQGSENANDDAESARNGIEEQSHYRGSGSDCRGNGNHYAAHHPMLPSRQRKRQTHPSDDGPTPAASSSQSVIAAEGSGPPKPTPTNIAGFTSTQEHATAEASNHRGLCVLRQVWRQPPPTQVSPSVRQSHQIRVHRSPRGHHPNRRRPRIGASDSIQTTSPATPPVQPHTGHPRKHPPSLPPFLTMSGMVGPLQSTRIHLSMFHANWDLSAGTPRPLATCHQGGIDSGPQVQATGRMPTVSRRMHGEWSFKPPSPLGTLTTDSPPTKCLWHDVQPRRKTQQLRELPELRIPARSPGSSELTRKRCRSIFGAGSAPHATPADASAAQYGGGLVLAPPPGTEQHSHSQFHIKTIKSSQQQSVT